MEARMEALNQLHAAVEKDDTASAAAALAAGANVNGALEGQAAGTTALHKACANGSPGCVRLLLAAGADVSLKEAAGNTTALHLAAYNRTKTSAECIQALLEAGADPCTVAGPGQHEGFTALHLAAFMGNLEAAHLLLRAAPRAAVRINSKGMTPFTQALALIRFGDFKLTARKMATAAYPLREAPLEAQDAGLVLAALLQTGNVAAPLYHLLARRLALTSEQWAAVPSPCLGLGAALPAVLQRSEAEAAQLVRHLPAAHRQQVRSLALCLGAAVRRGLLPSLPGDIQRALLVELAHQLGEDEIKQHDSSMTASQQEQEVQQAQQAQQAQQDGRWWQVDQGFLEQLCSTALTAATLVVGVCARAWLWQRA